MTFNCTMIAELGVTKYRFECDNMFLYVDKKLFDDNAILIGNKLQMQLNEDILLALTVNKKLSVEYGTSFNGNDILLKDKSLQNRIYTKDIKGYRVYFVRVLNDYDIQNIIIILQSNVKYLSEKGVQILQINSKSETTIGFQCICEKPNVLKAPLSMNIFGTLFKSKQLKLSKVITSKAQAYNTYNVYLVFKRG